MSENTEQDQRAAASGRRLLFWLVVGVVVLNVILFLKFGLEMKSSPAAPQSATNSTPAK